MKNLQKMITDYLSILARADNFSILANIPGMCNSMDTVSSYDGFMVIIEFNDTKELKKIIIPAYVLGDYEEFTKFVFYKTRR